jgi:outer membrane protein assembly factor BamB
MGRRLTLFASCAILALTPLAGISAADSPTAGQILEATGVQGGVIIHLGCGDGKLTAALGADERFIVHGLDKNERTLTQARAHIKSLDLYGRVSADTWSGNKLPYIDNCVNLIVAESGDVSKQELLRVLVPNGVAYTKSGSKWTKTIKPRPDEMDEWTHYLHNPTNNAVAQDSLIEPPSRYQWVGGMRYSRQHDHMSSVSALVSANGRVFKIFDEAPRASILIPPQWRLIARDAFNGTLLWKRDIGPWHNHLWPLKSGPQSMARRLVAVGDRVYVTLSIDGPLTAIDAATGETIRTYDDTKVTEEILCDNGVLFLSVAGEGQPLRSDPKRKFETVAEIKAATSEPIWTTAPRTVMAVDAESGKVLWQKKTPVVSMSLAADSKRVLFHDGECIQCLDRANGETLWSSEPLPKKEGMRTSGGVTLVIYDDVVLYDGQVATEKYPPKFLRPSTTMVALSAKDGKTLWKAEHPPCGHMGTPEDILVAGGLVWCGAVAQGQDNGVMIGRDLHTGETKSEFLPNVETHWFHHRCYRAKATDKYLLFSRTGIEFIDHAKENWICHHWVRGACHYGIMPCNGLIYAPQHPCACYIEAKLSGFSAVAPPVPGGEPRRDVPDGERLLKGPAYEVPLSAFGSRRSGDWPTFRQNAARSGSINIEVTPTDLKQTWETTLNGKLSSPVVAEGKLFVTSIDAHDVHALDEKTGKLLWTFTAGGRVDSPPTIWQGRAFFGSADGHVYCLRASDGALVWRYRAAPEERRMGAFEQLESVWPVHGSVLIQNEELQCVAGRSMFLDGGLRLLRLDPRTGHKISETILDDRDPETKENLQVHITGLNMPVGLPDILSSDGKYVYMRSLPFDLEGNRKFVEYINVKEQQGDDVHLFSPTGFLDDTLWHRTYWVYGRAFASGAGGYSQAGRVAPAGRLMVFNDKTVFGYGRHWNYYRWTTPLEFEIFATDKRPEIVRAGTERKPVKKDGKRTGTSRSLPVTRFVPSWSDNTSVQVTAMVLAKNALFAAGPPDVEDEELAVNLVSDAEMQRRLAEQSAAFEGRRGGLLVAVSPKDGKKLAGYRLDFAPRFDGLIAANGRLYCTTMDGTVVCLGDQGETLTAAADDIVTDRPIEIPAPDSFEEAAQKPSAAPAPPVKLDLPSAADEFAVTEGVQVFKSGSGYVVAPGAEGQSGYALKRLDTPATGKLTITGELTMHPPAEKGKGRQNGYLVFGDGSAKNQLIQCGVLLRRKTATIIEGSGKDAPRVEEKVPIEGSVTLEITVDLASGNVTLTVDGKSTSLELKRKLARVAYVGYGVQNAITEFGEVEVKQ